MIQAPDLKENLENQGMTCNNSTMASTDAEDFHPSARLKPVGKAVHHSYKELPEEDQITIEHSLDLVIKLECRQHCSHLQTNAMSTTMTGTPRKKGSPSVDLNQLGWQI